MKVYSGYQTLPEPLSASVVAVGNFDGVHQGHREIISRLKARAKQLHIPSVILTFSPHPVKLLVPHLAPPLINTYEQKRQLLSSLGVDIMLEEPFTRAYASYSPEQFVTSVLQQSLHAKEIFVGYDFTFGRGGKANVETLRHLGEPYKLKINCIEPLSFSGITASSTKVRAFVHEGQMEGAQLLLNRHFSLTGIVEEGEQRGRQLGFPTANLSTEQELLPKRGVYACWTEFEGQMYPTATNIGIRPTFSELRPTIEAHLIDFRGNLYQKKMTVHFVKKLRDERAFSSIHTLKEQIEQDIQQAKEQLVQPPNPSVF